MMFLRAKQLNINVITDNEARSVSVGYDKILEYTGLVFLAALIIAGSLLSYHIKNSSLKKEYTSVSAEFSESLGQYKTELEKMDRFKNKINLMIGDKLSSGIFTEKVYGIGALEEEIKVELLANYSKEFDGTIINEFNFFKKIKDINNSFDILLIEMQKIRDKLDSTPSIIPVKGYITSEFGYRISPFTGKKHLHRGIDITNKIGTPVMAAAKGTVADISKNNLWGLNVTIDHGNNIRTQYGHLNKVLVKKGQVVTRGKQIAELGKSGRTTGPHLHYQIWTGEIPVDPYSYIVNDF